GLNLTTGASVIANPTTSITYSITGNANGCSTVKTFALTVGSAPVIGSSANTSVCSGSSTALTASGATTYTWSPSTGLNVSTGASVTATPSSNTTYTITGTSNSCSATKTVAVTVNALPVISSSANATICSGSSTTIFASGGTTYSWSPATGLNLTTGASVIATPSSSTTYTITGTSNGCSNTKAVALTVNAIPVVSTSANTIICTGSSTTLTANGATAYSWSPSTGLNVTTGTSVTANPNTSLTYSVTGTTNGCTNTKTISVTVSLSLVLTLSGSPVLCSGSSTSLTVSGASNYTWSPSTGLNVTTGSSVSASPTSNLTYTITGSSGICNSTKTVAMTVNALPVVSVIGNSSTCSGTSISLSASGASTYSWSPSTGLNVSTGASVTATPGSSITYTVTGTAANGCVNISTKTITINALPGITYTSVNPSSGQSNGSINITVSGAQSPYTYHWSNNATTEDLSSLAAGTFTVTVTTATGCVAVQSVTLTNTSSTCNTTAGASFMNTTASSTIIMWGGVTGAYRYNLRSRPVGTTVWTLQSTNGANAAFTLSGLMQSTPYEVQIQTQCDAAGTNLSTFSASFLFTTISAAREEENNSMQNDLSDFNLFPNPTSDEILLEFSNAVDETVSIRIYDMAGREMKIASLEKGQTSLTIPLQDFPQGLYSLVIIGQNLREVRKVLKQ
ncbi:MAG: T9SS type A sorting domain-containing protein, partial [Bacteroidota bacterium]